MRVLGLAALLVVAGCLGGDKGVNPPERPPAWFAFSQPLNLTDPTDGAGSEPSILATQNGDLYIVSVLGSAQARGDGLWKSTDGGGNWTYLGKPDYPFGGGDADLDEDTGGRIYLPGQWRPVAPPPESPLQPYITGGESMATSEDGGATWNVYPVASVLPVTDRQWTGTYGAGTAYLAFNQAQQGLVVTKSVDGGKTWAALRTVPGTWDAGDGITSGGPNGIPGDILVDPEGNLLIPYGPGIGGGSRDHRLFVSRDGGATFEARIIHRAPDGEQAGAIFGTLARDSKGGLYYAWSESQDGGARGMRVLLRISTDGGAKWSLPLQVSPPGMTSVFPWLVAGAPAHVAIAFYGAVGGFLSDRAPEDAAWYPILALSQNAEGTNGTFHLATLSPWPNHRGPLCTGGTSCAAGTRDLGDFFEIALTPKGQVVGVWVDDTGDQRLDVFGRQVLGSLAS